MRKINRKQRRIKISFDLIRTTWFYEGDDNHGCKYNWKKNDDKKMRRMRDSFFKKLKENEMSSCHKMKILRILNIQKVKIIFNKYYSSLSHSTSSEKQKNEFDE